MRVFTRTASVAVAASAALLLAACGGGDDDGGTGSGGDDATGGTVSVNSTEPQNPLIPTDTNEVGGGNIVDAMWTGLVSYDSETGEPGLAVAESTAPHEDFT
jgi:oligopeptide transport system substrate-binding protein